MNVLKYLPHQQRVVDEKQQLDAKIRGLGSFIDTSPVFLSLDAKEQDLLKSQRQYMLHYSDILDQRIGNF